MTFSMNADFELNADIQIDGIAVGSGFTLDTEAGRTITFNTTEGFDGSAGTINCPGTSGSHIAITGANGWKNDADLKWDTVTYVDTDKAAEGLTIANGHTPTDISNITIDSCTVGIHAYGSFCQITNAEITSCTTDIEVDANKTLTMLESNFDGTKVTANGGLVSKNHNDVGNTWNSYGTVNTNNTCLVPLSTTYVVVKEGDLAFGSAMHNNVVKNIIIEDASGTCSADQDVTVWFELQFMNGGLYGQYVTGPTYGIISKGTPVMFTAWNIAEIKNGKEVKNYGEIWNLPEVMMEAP